MDHDKSPIIQRIGEKIDASLGGDKDKASKLALGERRLQTWILGIIAMIASGTIVSILTVFAGLPGQVARLANDVNASRNETSLILARIERRLESGEAKDAQHDEELQTLMRRVDRNDYVLSISPATAQFARAAELRNPKPPNPSRVLNQETAVKPDDR